ncbi:MAG: hypothetical protein NC111_02990 [Bacteroides sp.]|nr:hypothetical protein [Bacteroides sp.]MCM1412816.1 hypothetical protein [Bacteroides sp.]MCM1471485.1 hypothetical protein [Bacteroides sp.]
MTCAATSCSDDDDLTITLGGNASTVALGKVFSQGEPSQFGDIIPPRIRGLA